LFATLPNGVGRSPRAAAAVPTLLQNLTQAGGPTTLAWVAEAGRTYQVQYTAELSQPNWINLGSLITGNHTLISFDASTNQQRFYRVRVLP
jgi:hypothetical protein